MQTTTSYRTDGTTRTIRSGRNDPSRNISSTISHLSSVANSSSTSTSPKSRRPRESRVKDDATDDEATRVGATHTPNRRRRNSIIASNRDIPIVTPISVSPPARSQSTTPSQMRNREQVERFRPKETLTHTRSPAAPAAPGLDPRPELVRAVASEAVEVAYPVISRPRPLLPAARILPTSIQDPTSSRRSWKNHEFNSETGQWHIMPDTGRDESKDVLIWEAMHRASLAHSGVPPPSLAPCRSSAEGAPGDTMVSRPVKSKQVFNSMGITDALRDHERKRHAALIARARTDARRIAEDERAAILDRGQKISHEERRAQKKARDSPKQRGKNENDKQVKVMPETAKEVWDEPGAGWYRESPKENKHNTHSGLIEGTENGQGKVVPQSWYHPKKEQKPWERKGWWGFLR